MRTLVAVAALSIAAGAPAAPGAVDRQARFWASTCAACHNTDGRSQGAMPAINGRDAEALLKALLEFKQDLRPGATVMHQHAKGYSDDELRRIAKHFSTLPGR